MVKEGEARPSHIEENAEASCQLPTMDNPMGNMLLSDFTDRPDRPSACYHSSVKRELDVTLNNRMKYMAGRSRTACTAVSNERPWRDSLYRIRWRLPLVTRRVSRNGVTVRSSSRCADLIRHIVTRMPEVFSSRLLPVLIRVAIRELVCTEVLFVPVNKYSYVIINGVSTPTWVSRLFRITGALPSVKATEEIFVYPQPSSINCGGCRPNTMLYGTAPYMAGKGSPAQYIDVSDQLRPQTTSRFNKVVVPTYERNLFPLSNMEM